MFQALNITASIAQFFGMFTSLFIAGDKTAKSLVHLSSWAEEETEAFNQLARLKREHDYLITKAQLEKQLAEAKASLPKSK